MNDWSSVGHSWVVFQYVVLVVLVFVCGGYEAFKCVGWYSEVCFVAPVFEAHF